MPHDNRSVHWKRRGKPSPTWLVHLQGDGNQVKAAGPAGRSFFFQFVFVLAFGARAAVTTASRKKRAFLPAVRRIHTQRNQYNHQSDRTRHTKGLTTSGAGWRLHFFFLFCLIQTTQTSFYHHVRPLRVTWKRETGTYAAITWGDIKKQNKSQ